MVEGLEVTIRYRGAKYEKVATPTTASSEFAILKKDLAHLRVHSPSQKNVRRVNGSFILHWPNAGTNAKVAGLADSLHTRWFKLCSDDPEALKLRDFLSIESIKMVQDGALIRSTTGLVLQTSQDVPPAACVERLGGHLPETVQQPGPSSASAPSLPAKPPPPPVIPPPRVPPTAPRSDRRSPPHLKRRMSDGEDSGGQTRQKLDMPEALTATPLQSIDVQPQPTRPPTSPKTGHPPIPPAPADATQTSPQPMQVDGMTATPSIYAEASLIPMAPDTQMMISPSSNREPGEMTPQAVAPSPAPPITSPSSHSGPGPASTQDTRPTASHHPSPYTLRPASPYASSSSSGNGEHHAPRKRDHDVNRLMRELWDTRRQLTAMQAREQVLLGDLELLGERPEDVGRTGRSSNNGASRDEMMRLQADLRTEKARRTRAERVLSDVERERQAPFVVPALFQAFLSISELSN